jgi:hypothetical protein
LVLGTLKFSPELVVESPSEYKCLQRGLGHFEGGRVNLADTRV